MTFNIKKSAPLILGSLLVVLAGVATAWLINTKVINKTSVASPGAEVTSKGAGILDPNIKYQNATGELKEGGIGNEGTHHVERDNLASHNIYLTSSVIDLQSFVGKKVQIWGETLASKKAPWLMDVAKIQIVD